MVHIFASETDHFPPIKALFELVTSVTLSIFQQGRGGAPAWVGVWTSLNVSARLNGASVVCVSCKVHKRKCGNDPRNTGNKKNKKQTEMLHVAVTRSLGPHRAFAGSESEQRSEVIWVLNHGWPFSVCFHYSIIQLPPTGTGANSKVATIDCTLGFRFPLNIRQIKPKKKSIATCARAACCSPAPFVLPFFFFPFFLIFVLLCCFGRISNGCLTSRFFLHFPLSRCLSVDSNKVSVLLHRDQDFSFL